MTPPVGFKISLDGQDFHLVEVGPHTRTDGSPSFLLTWKTACPSCGDGFTIVGGMSFGAPDRRRCTACRQPGKPVRKERK